MILTDNDYRNIASQITEGKNRIEYAKDGEILFIDCEYETEGSWEDDFYNGTGAWVEFDRNLYIEAAECLDANGEKVGCKVDKNRLERLIA